MCHLLASRWMEIPFPDSAGLTEQTAYLVSCSSRVNSNTQMNFHSTITTEVSSLTPGNQLCKIFGEVFFSKVCSPGYFTAVTVYCNLLPFEGPNLSFTCHGFSLSSSLEARTLLLSYTSLILVHPLYPISISNIVICRVTFTFCFHLSDCLKSYSLRELCETFKAFFI